jgi:glycosyltransferase involved in cell wall biosynthesis
VEGLPIVAGEHYLLANEPAELAAELSRLLADAELRARLSAAARRYVEESCSFRAIARQFEGICELATANDASGRRAEARG